jgi:hypothetical protein
VTVRYRMIGEDLIEPEALRLVPGLRAGTRSDENGTELPTLEARLVRREGIEPSTY